MKITVEYSDKEQIPLKVVSAKYKSNYIVELVLAIIAKSRLDLALSLENLCTP